MFEWDRHNLRKIRAHRIKQEEAEDVSLMIRFQFMNKTLRVSAALSTTAKPELGRLLAVIVTERGGT
jgi:hypothetical protein